MTSQSGPGTVSHARKRTSLRPSLPSAIICAAVFVLVVTLWRTGQFQSAELGLYDRFLKFQWGTSAVESPVVIVGLGEADLHGLNAPQIPDDALSQALQNILNDGPAAVVVDFYRDLPVPGKDPDGQKQLAAVFDENPILIAIQRLGLGNEPPVPPPPFLEGKPDQVGFNDFSVQDLGVDETVRRVTLIMEDGQIFYSDPLMATLNYLQEHGIDYNLDDPRHIKLGKTTLRRFEPNDGAYVNADAHGYQLLLDFRGPKKFPTYSFLDALSGKIPPRNIQGKVVLLGPLAPSLKDYVRTPIKGRFEGLMLHAHLVDQLVRKAIYGEPSLRFWGEWQELLWILLWCVIGTFAGSSVRSPVVFVLVVAGCLGVLAAIYWFSLMADLWLLAAAPAVALTSAAALGTSLQAYLEKKQRDVLMDLFSQHVSTGVASDIWDRRDQFMDGHRPKPQVIPGTVIFTDLKGFSGTAETLSPEALLNWLNEYMEVMAAAIETHGGMVNKYMGDAIMAVFGAPVPRATEEEIRRDANNAMLCALAMGEQLDRLNQDWERRGLPVTMMRIGVASGPLVSGSIGGARRLEYTVTGDTVVTAKRLESAEKGSTEIESASRSCRVLLSEDTFSMLDPQFKTRKVGPMRLDGKHQIVNVYVLIGNGGNPI